MDQTFAFVDVLLLIGTETDSNVTVGVDGEDRQSSFLKQGGDLVGGVLLTFIPGSKAFFPLVPGRVFVIPLRQVLKLEAINHRFLSE